MIYNVISYLHITLDIIFCLSELGSENLRTMLYIVQAYLYLAPEEFIINCGEKVCTRLNVSKKGFDSFQYNSIIVLILQFNAILD